MRSINFNVRPLVILIILAALSVASAQTGARPTPPNGSASALTTVLDWETLRPEGEGFSVQMPKGSTFESSKEPYHKMELNTRMYIASSAPGPVFAVVSLSGIKSNPALYTEMQRTNSYVDAFKTLFPPKVRKDAAVKLTLVGEKTLQGYAGREYRLTVGDLDGTAEVYTTRKRFYAIVYLNTKKQDTFKEQFLSSFVLPEKTETMTATAPPQEPTTVAEEAPTTNKAPEVDAAEQPKPGPDAKPTDLPNASASGNKRPISGGVLNGKAISMPRPDYSAEAKAAGADGVVVVQVTIDEQGNVTEAHAVSGHALLQPASVTAALQAKFSPTLLAGEPVKVTGVLVYNFGRPLS